ncbi:putative transcriptional regulator with HTH domain [Mycobacteroides abscessus subsp. abscessus]|uniref:AlbA family DNA-binding domain-containing protein n=1 Tax=Mycobacteroides abscessus TaxID=36809 RepID=UPI00092B6471|nr:ATP-binding protein [Mycobacteroides abscessus]SHU63705.1 putative transcriptional regulator with HTH domain [Mycobacteroides abscessus subsp. abscessus]
MIISDGRMDFEKLKELLGNPEQTHLDLKSKVDLTSAADKLKFAKDAVTMASRPEGGYILIGVDDDGIPCSQIGEIADRSLFDGSRLGSLIRKYVEASVHVKVSIHELDGNEIVMAYVHNPDCLPIPFDKDGQYPGPNGDSVTVFRRGEIFVREGAENVPLRYPHWADILSLYIKKIRDESTEAALTMLREVLGAGTRTAGEASAAGVPLTIDMDEATFTAAAERLLEAGNDIRLRQFLRPLGRAVRSGTDLPEFSAAVDRWTIYCAQALQFDRHYLVEEAIERLVDGYKTLGVGNEETRKRLLIVERIYVLGSLAVRLEAWETVRQLALRPVPGNVHEPDYVFASWIRAAQVYASRAGLTDDPRGGYILSAARELMVLHPGMRPDLNDADIADGEVTSADAALNSLCEFDIAYCFVVAAMGQGRGGAYPWSAAFDEDRAKPIAQQIVSNAAIRLQLFPDVEDRAIAAAIQSTYSTAVSESANNYGGRWWGMPSNVKQFVTRHLP